MKKTNLLLAFVAGLGLSSLYAQNFGEHAVAISIPEIAILDIESSTSSSDVTFDLNANNLEAGEEFTINETNSNLWINYTSVVQGALSSRNVTVELDAATFIQGMVLKVVASAHTLTGGGQYGTPTAIVTPTDLPQNLITDIGSSFTGNGQSKGHNLTYSLDFSGNFEDLNVDGASMNFTMKYTITD